MSLTTNFKVWLSRNYAIFIAWFNLLLCLVFSLDVKAEWKLVSSTMLVMLFKTSILSLHDMCVFGDITRNLEWNPHVLIISDCLNVDLSNEYVYNFLMFNMVMSIPVIPIITPNNDCHFYINKICIYIN